MYKNHLLKSILSLFKGGLRRQVALEAEGAFSSHEKRVLTFVLEGQEFEIQMLAPNSYQTKKSKLFQSSSHRTVLDLALRNNLPIENSCDGSGTCGTCRVELLESSAAADMRNETEREFAEERGLKANERLACQLLAKPGMRIRIR